MQIGFTNNNNLLLLLEDIDTRSSVDSTDFKAVLAIIF